jgi:ABC-type oligopeptide transport system substrate-binding subunit
MLAVDGIYMNMKSKPLKDPRVRRALTMALRRTQLVKRALGASATPYAGYIPQGEWGSYAHLALYPYSRSRARAALRAAGYSRAKRFPSLTLYYVDDPSLAELAHLVTRAWKRTLHINVQTQALTINTLFARVQQNSLPLYLFGWSADYPDPHDWLALQWRSDAPNNEVHYRNLRFDALVETADVSWSWQRRDELYNAAQQILVDDAAWIPLYIPHRLTYIRPDIQNVQVTGYGVIPGSGDWTSVRIRLPSKVRDGAF